MWYAIQLVSFGLGVCVGIIIQGIISARREYRRCQADREFHAMLLSRDKNPSC